MLPRLMAEETLERASAAALGGGAMKPAEARRLAAALRRQAGPGSRSAGQGPDPRALAFIGIEVKEV
ncbi:MAG: hypothetical protein ACE5GS_15190 [Kiloniellaceae bacterium]